MLEGVNTPKLSTTSGKNTPPAASTSPLCQASFSISPLKAANPGEMAECAITPECTALLTESSNWNLPFNDAKFVHMRFWESFHDNHSEYTINNKLIEQKSFHKDLGITFTNDLNWAKHISTICAKAYQTLGLLRRTFKTNCVEAKK